MDDKVKFAVLASLGALMARIAEGRIEPPAIMATLRATAKLLGPQAMVKDATVARPSASWPIDGLADEVRAAGFRLSDTQVEEMVREGTTATISGSAEVRRMLASFSRRQLPEWARKMEEGKEAFLRKLVREHALEPATPKPPPAREPEQQPLLDRPVSLHEVLAEHPELVEKAGPLLAGFGDIVKPESKRPNPAEFDVLEGARLEEAKRRAKGETP